VDLKQRIRIPPWLSWRWTITLALAAVCFTLITVFVAENFVVVKVRLIFFRVETRLAWSLLFAATLGFLLGLLTARLRR